MRAMWHKLSLPGLAIMLGTIGLLAAGCGPSNGNGNQGNLAKNQVFNYNLPSGGSGDVATLDPNIVQDANSAIVIYLTYDGLVTLDKDLNIENWAAKSVDVSSDGLTYTFHLRDGLAFTDGTPITSKNFAYSIDRTLNPCLASPVSYYLFPIKDAQTYSGQTCKDGVLSNPSGAVINSLVGDSLATPDDKTLVITLQQPAAYFLNAMTYPTSYAVEPSVIGSDITSEKWLDSITQGATGRGTSGMFYVQKWDHSAGTIVLKQNPHWWGLKQGKTPHLTEINFTLFKDADTAYAAYQAGQFDVGFPTTQLVDQARSKPDFHQVGTLTYYGVDFNWTKPPFNSLDARKAFCLAINRDQLNNSVLKKTVQPHWNIVPKGMPGYNPNVSGPDGVTSTAGDPAKAMQAWNTYKASLNGAAPASVTYLYVAGSTAQKQLAEALQSQWQQALGVQVALKGEDFNTFVSDTTAGNYIATRFGWLDDYPDPQDVLTLLFSTTAQYNSQKASVPQADQLMTQADQENDKTKRLQMYNQAEQLLINNVATCPMYQALTFYQVRPYVNNWYQNAGATTPLDAWIATSISNH